MRPSSLVAALACQNAESVAGAFTLSTSGASDSTGVSLLGQLDVRIEDCSVYADGNPPTCGSATSKVLKTGTKLNGVGSIDLGSFAGGEKHRYKFDVTLPHAEPAEVRVGRGGGGRPTRCA